MFIIPYSRFKIQRTLETKKNFSWVCGKLIWWQNLTWIDEVTCIFTPLEGEYSYLCYRNINVVFGGMLTQTMMGILNNMPFTDCRMLKFTTSSEFWNTVILKSFRWWVVDLNQCVCVFIVLTCFGHTGTDCYSSFI